MSIELAGLPYASSRPADLAESPRYRAVQDHFDVSGNLDVALTTGIEWESQGRLLSTPKDSDDAGRA